MAGAIESITQTEGTIQFFASGTYTQPADDNANIHIHTGFKPKFVLTSTDPLAAVAVGVFGHWAEMADADSTDILTGADLATGVTIRDNWQFLRLDHRDRRRQRRLAVVNVTNRPYVDVRFLAFKFCLRHCAYPYA